MPRGAARRASARGLRRGSARAAGVLCGRSWRGGGARLHRGRRPAAPLTIDCLRLRDVGGGEIDQPTALAVHLHRAQGQPRRYSPVSERTHVRAQLAAHTHTETTERCHTTHACARRSAELLNIHSGPRSAAGAPREVRASPPCRATFGDSASATRPRASGSAGEAWRPLALEPGHGPAAASPAAPATAGARLPTAVSRSVFSPADAVAHRS